MGQALYRKYRSKKFSDVVGQEHITKTLEHALASGKISHAYLFTGPRGVGKTSVARILAHEVNGIPYTDDSMHLDIIEIDAASNRRIDEIRELRDKVHIAPSSGKYKVYIIDEVHMLTREAFNALLKTLEEPPAHGIFILATTEAHKLPETIISRTQRFSFKPVDKESVTKHLADIAKREKIDTTPDALKMLAEHGQGSFRDSISLLDQLGTSGQKITEDTVRSLIGLPTHAGLESVINHIKNGESAQLVNDLERLFGQGISAAVAAKELSKILRNELVHGGKESWVPALLRELLQVPTSLSPQEQLEIALLEAAGKNTKNNPTDKDDEHDRKPPTPADKIADVPKTPKSSNKTAAKMEAVKQKVSANFDNESWPQIVEYTKSHNASLYTALRLAMPVFADGILTLNFRFPLHQKKINQSAQKDLIGEIIENITGAKIKIECVVNKEAFENSPKEIKSVANELPKNFTNQLQTISNIFGNAEMLES